ncbi:MAG TPA: PilZ domain-containing protein [Terriglobales bacterium]|nr:PilZ domain-containing protein [Terriglobales bacterium]
MARKRGPSDKRQWQRIPLAIPVFIRGVDLQGNEFLEFATALNISAGGALVATRRQLPRSSRLSLEIPVAPVPRAMSLPKAARKLRATLVRVNMEQGFQLWGLKFANNLAAKGRRARRSKKNALSYA